MKEQLRFSGKLTGQDLGDVRKIVRSKWYWPKLVAINWYGLTLFGIASWATIEGLAGSAHPNWRGLGLLWLVVVGLFGLAFFSARRAMAKQFSSLNTRLPEWITLSDEGVQRDGPNGAKTFNPWGGFTGWREGTRVVLLDFAGEDFLILPVGDRLDVERESLRQFLRTHLPHTSTPVTA